MDNDRALAVPERMMALSDMMTLGDLFAKSGFFTDSRQAAQAVVKIQAGRELGFPPVVSMTGINIVQGKVSIGAGLLAALIKRSNRYDYHVKALSDTNCTLAFSDGGKPVYESSFSLDDAKKAGLLGKDNWGKYPRNMLFARALSNGARFVCPHLVTGVYTPDELGLAVDSDGNAVIDSTATPIVTAGTTGHGTPPTTPATQAAEQKPAATPAATRPYDAEQLKAAYARIVPMCKPDPVKDGYKGYIASWLELCFAGQADSEPKRHSLVRHLTGKTSLNDLTPQELRAIGRWLNAKPDSGGAYHIDPLSEQEAQRVITQVMRDVGQQELPMSDEPEAEEMSGEQLVEFFGGDKAGEAGK